MCTYLHSQKHPAFDHDPVKPFQKRLALDGIYNWISPGVAESLLVYKAEPVLKHPAMEARFKATVVVGFELGKDGEVLHPMVISGPKMLQQSVLNAVRHYKYKPYLLNGEPLVVATWLSVLVSNY